MGRLRQGVPAFVFLLFAWVCASCGGGPTLSIQPPPPVPDFSIGFSANSVSVQQGGTSSPVNLSVTPLNGFTGTVQVTLTALPAGVTSSPASPFNVSSGASTPLIFGAAANAGTGTFTVSAQGSSGALSHSSSVGLSIQSGVVSALPRTTFVRTDATSAADDPFGEPHHRHIAYDAANKHVFAANRAMNRVEVFSSTTQTRIAQISVAGASSADLSADGSTVWVGTSLEEIVAIDTTSLQIKNRYVLAGLTPLPNTIFDRPVEVLSLSNGKCMVRLRQPVSSEALLAFWDPASNSLANLTSAAPAVFQQGVGVLARSGDHTKVVATAADSSGELALFDSTGNVVAGPLTIGTGLISRIAANLDGSRFAVLFAAGGSTQIIFLDAGLHQLAAYSPALVHGIAFSRDGKNLYVSESTFTASFITILDGQSAQLIAHAPDAAIQSVSSEIEEADETQLLFSLSNRGISFVDASTTATIPSAAPVVAAAPSLQPPEGPSIGGTSVALAGQNFTSPAQLKFGTQLAASATVSSATQIQASSPPSVSNGPVNVTAYFQNGWLALAPDAFSYGPQILQIFPGAGSNAGGDSIQIYGYGFGSDPTKITAKIGGASATVQKVENVTNIAPSLALDASYPFSIERITLQTPPAPPAKPTFSFPLPLAPRPPRNHFNICRAFTSIQNRETINS